MAGGAEMIFVAGVVAVAGVEDDDDVCDVVV